MFVGLLIVAASAVFVYEVVRALRLLHEHQITTPSWVQSEPPGQLDFPVDGNRALRRFAKELDRLTKRTARLNRKIERHSKLIVRAADWDPRIKRLIANRPSKYIARNGIYIQKRADLLKALVRDVHRNYEGLISILPLDTETSIQAAKVWRDSLSGMHEGMSSAIESNIGYRDSVRNLEIQNPSRALRLACRQLADGLDAVVLVLGQHEKRSGELVRAFDQRLSGKSA